MVDVQGIKEVSEDRVCDGSDEGWVFVGGLGDFLADDAAECRLRPRAKAVSAGSATCAVMPAADSSPAT
jgi:hypothetical protein